MTIAGGIGGGTIHRGVFEGSGGVGNLLHDGDLEIRFYPERLEVIPVRLGPGTRRTNPGDLCG